MRPVGSVTIEPLDGGARSRVTLEFELEGRGYGKLLAPLGNREARKHIPKQQAKLKERLERRVDLGVALQVSVIGSGAEHEARAEEVGRLLAERGCTVVCGGPAR